MVLPAFTALPGSRPPKAKRQVFQMRPNSTSLPTRPRVAVLSLDWASLRLKGSIQRVRNKLLVTLFDECNNINISTNISL